MESKRRLSPAGKLLIWAPVFLLPLANILFSAAADVRPGWSQLAPVLLGAVVEEVFFRFFVLRSLLLRELKPAFAILLVSLLFAGMHLFNLRSGQRTDLTLLQVACAFCFSVWAGAATWRSTWLIPLLAHVLLNMTAVEEAPWVSLAVSAAVLADGVMLYLLPPARGPVLPYDVGAVVRPDPEGNR